MTSFQQSLIDIRADRERKKSEFEESWLSTRRLIFRCFTEASEVLDGAKVEHDNGTSSTLYYRDGSITFKTDERRLKILRVRAGEPDERYDPDALTQDKMESEVRNFVSAVLGGG
jgi:outer membrane protein assembly factor BamA